MGLLGICCIVADRFGGKPIAPELSYIMEIRDDSRRQQAPLDGLFADQFVLAVLLSICCAGIGLLFAIIGLISAKDPKAKKNAMICVIVGGATTFIVVVFNIIWFATG